MEKKKFKIAPLSAGYMATSMLGFLISAIYVYSVAPAWGVAFCAVFAAMFIAAVGSMTAADADLYVAVETRGKKKR